MAGGASGWDPTSAQEKYSTNYRNRINSNYSENDYKKSRNESEHLWEGNSRRNLKK